MHASAQIKHSCMHTLVYSSVSTLTHVACVYVCWSHMPRTLTRMTCVYVYRYVRAVAIYSRWPASATNTGIFGLPTVYGDFTRYWGLRAFYDGGFYADFTPVKSHAPTGMLIHVYGIQLQKAREYACCRYCKRVVFRLSIKLWCRMLKAGALAISRVGDEVRI